MAYVILCRVSTEKQAESGAGIDGQEDACRAFIERNPGEITAVLHEEDFSAGLPLHKRPVLIEAIDLLKRGDVLLVHKRDRMFRGDPFTNGMIEHEIRKKGATLRSVMGEGTENDDPANIFMRRILDGAAEYERNLIKQRTKNALQSRKRRGLRVGEIPFGYRLASDGEHLEKDLGQQAVIGRILSLRASGESYRAICQKLDSEGVATSKGSSWAPASVRRIVQRHAEPCVS